METNVEQNSKVNTSSQLTVWLKRMGVVGFTFFLVKGLVWLAIFSGIIKLF